MNVPTCRRCPTPLKATQGRFCSPRCANAHPALSKRPCAHCGRLLTRRQASHRNQIHCSNECRGTAPHYTTRLVVLDILRANQHAFMTTSDLAIWVHGYDDPSELVAIRSLLCRLRREGYAIESTRATWARGRRGPENAYRLVSEPAVRKRRAAA